MKNLKIKSENNLRVKNFRLKRKCDNLNSTIGDLNIKLDLLHKKFEIESSFVKKLKNCVSEVLNEILQSVPLTLFFLSRCILKILESCELLCCHKMQKFCKEKK